MSKNLFKKQVKIINYKSLWDSNWRENDNFIKRNFVCGAGRKQNFILINWYGQSFTLHKNKRMIILYAVPISLWPMLGKENQYFFFRHPHNNDRWHYITFQVIYVIKMAFFLKFCWQSIKGFKISINWRKNTIFSHQWL